MSESVFFCNFSVFKEDGNQLKEPLSPRAVGQLGTVQLCANFLHLIRAEISHLSLLPVSLFRNDCSAISDSELHHPR